MTNRLHLYKGKVWLAGLLLGAGFCGASAAVEPPADPERRNELVQLLRQDCGSCHGLTLKGGLGPALTRAALAGKAPEALRATIYYGRPGTPMPPWRGFLTEEEAGWLAEILIQGKLETEQ